MINEEEKMKLKRIRFQQRFENFGKAYKKFEDVAKLDTEHTEVARMAAVQTFEFTFELAWKAMGDLLESEKKIGDDEVFPREIIRRAYEAKYIDDQNVWIEALDNRNKSSHVYNEVFAANLERFIRLSYAPALKNLYEYFKRSLNK